MKLNLKAALESLLRWGGKSSDADAEQEDLPVSMVLLLREPRFHTVDQLQQAGERAFGASFAEGKESQHSVVQALIFTLMKVGPHTLSFLNQTRPYGDAEFRREFAQSLQETTQRQALAEHRAWTAVDYVKGRQDLELEYTVLATLCSELVNSNCLALYVPEKLMLIPNDDRLRNALQRMSLSRHLEIKRDRVPS